MVFETLGAINEEGQDVLRCLFRYAAKRLGLEFSSYCARAWARLSCTLQRMVAQSILTRIDGREFREPTPDAAPPPRPSNTPPITHSLHTIHPPPPRPPPLTLLHTVLRLLALRPLLRRLLLLLL